MDQRFRFVGTSWLLLALLPLASPQILKAQLAYTTNNGVITITRYIGTNSGVFLPSTINGLPVTGLGTHAFYNLPTLFSVTIPGSITNFENSAFDTCSNMAGVYFQGGSLQT